MLAINTSVLIRAHREEGGQSSAWIFVQNEVFESARGALVQEM